MENIFLDIRVYFKENLEKHLLPEYVNLNNETYNIKMFCKNCYYSWIQKILKGWKFKKDSLFSPTISMSWELKKQIDPFAFASPLVRKLKGLSFFCNKDLITGGLYISCPNCDCLDFVRRKERENEI
mgnify:CR=1 FL=1